MVILAAIGGEHQQDRVVEVGHDLAAAYDDELVVLHVMEEEQFEEIRGRTEVSSPVIIPSGGEGAGLTYRVSERSESGYNLEYAAIDAAEVAEDCVDETLGEERRATVRTKGRVGDPAAETVAEAEHLDARYVVVGGRRRSPAGKAIFGSVSQSVILDSDRPVVAITRRE